MYTPKRETEREEMIRDILESIGAVEEPGVVDDVARYGADAGYGAFTYTTDCVDFYERHADTIDAMLAEDAEEFGYESIPAFIADFARSDMAATDDGYRNLLAWYALERVCRDFVDGCGDLSDYIEMEDEQ